MSNKHVWFLPFQENLNEVYSLIARHNEEGCDGCCCVDDASDILFGDIDRAISRGYFDHCDEIIRLIDINLLDPNILVMVLEVTFTAAFALANRAKFFADTENFLVSLIGVDETNKVLDPIRQ